jgi:hypothetical protein
MLRCGLVENEEAAMARFMGGLTREIQDILAYKEYTNVTRLFHLACEAEREVQGRRMRTNTDAGRNTSWQPRTSAASPNHDFQGEASNRSSTTSKSAPSRTIETGKGSSQATAKSSSIASTRRTKDIQCLQTKDLGTYEGTAQASM